MSLLTYQEARPWARSIRDNVANGVMPPWHADPAHGKWLNDRRLSTAEKDTIVRWVTAGAPEGNARDLPKLPEYAQGWTIGQPDAIVTMDKEYSVPAQGEIPYQYFEMPTNFTEDKWIQALEVRRGNSEVVHHVLVYARFPGLSRPTQAFRAQNPPGPMSPTMAKEMEEAKANPQRLRPCASRARGEACSSPRLLRARRRPSLPRAPPCGCRPEQCSRSRSTTRPTARPPPIGAASASSLRNSRRRTKCALPR